MKRMIFFLASSLILLGTYCTQVKFDNPIDPNGTAFKGDSLTKDHDGDGIANEFDLDYWKINDKIPPVITFNGGTTNHDTVIFRQGDPEGVLTSTATVTATDNISTPDKIILFNSSLFTSQCGPQTVTYTATDEAGNSFSKTRIIIVDCDPPVITLIGGNPVNVNVDATYVDSARQDRNGKHLNRTYRYHHLYGQRPRGQCSDEKTACGYFAGAGHRTTGARPPGKQSLHLAGRYALHGTGMDRGRRA
jgi:hypothetical protein